ncbi:AIR synthase family protein [Candidatus Bathyarchaeota archaeon]|nr:AIR synthase family protein [Candidatus Bathyarchaeota archaeon]
MSDDRNLATGKIPKDVLNRLVLTCLGAHSDRVLKGPKVGEDAALLDMGDRIIIAKANPITGAEIKIGWLAVHINANDVAARGGKPLWYLSTILLPEGAHESLLETIMKEQHEACCALGISIVGGHTEVVKGLPKAIVSGFMLGEVSAESMVTTDGARIGDDIILTKGVGIEGTGILASDLRHKLGAHMSAEQLDSAAKFLDMISVVPEAMAASSIGVHSMHTPTEGGVLNGLLEISEACKLGFTVSEADMPVHDETKAISEALGIDPLKLLSSGSLLICSDPGRSKDILGALEKIGVKANVIGKITDGSCVIIDGNGIERAAGEVIQDELFRILESQ